MVRTDRVKANFYPSTGRWNDCRYPGKIMKGGARCFVGWLKKQGVL